MRDVKRAASWLLAAAWVAACAPLNMGLVPTPTASAGNAAPVPPVASAANPAASVGPYEPTRIAPNVIADRIKQGEAFLPVDVRSADAFLTEHIEGAVHAPYADILAGKAALPKDRTLLLYCT